MKVKNIMFFGFAAAILSAGAASAAPNYTTVVAGAADNKIVTSKSYVDSKDALLNQDIALKQDKIVAGTNITIGADGKTISATDTTYTADGTTVALNGTTFSANTTGGVAENGTNLVTGGQVYNYVATATDIDNFVEDSITDGVTDKAPSENAVHDALAEKQDTLVAGDFISIAADGKTITTTYSAGTNVQIANDGTISATDTTYTADGTTVALNGTTFSANTNGGVGTGNGNLVTGGQVQTAIDGAIADVTYEKDATCTAGVPCALVDDGTTKKWYGMAI